MAKKKKNWFQILKKLFVSESKPKPEKKEKKKRWFFGRFKFKRLPPVVVPSKEEKTLSEIEEDHCKHALTVAIATAAAAEAAVAASQAAAEILRLTRTPKSYLRTKSRRLHDSSAIKIQTAFRGYLARKALRALKGLVKLQAMVRGRAVRRQAITSLKGLQCLVRIQSQIRERRIRMAESSPIDADKKQFLQPNKELIEINNQRKHNEDPSSSEGFNSIVLSRQGSLIRRKQVKQEKNIDYVLHSYPSYREMERQSEHKTTDLSEDEKLRDLSSSISLRRRSFDKQSRCFIGESDTFTSSSSSSSIPNYMSATESAKAKARLNSTANQRHGYSESCSDFYSSASKNRLSFSSASNDFIVPPKTPRMKSLSVSLKSRSILKDLSTDSDRSMLILNQQSCLSDFQQNGNQRL